MAQENSTGFPHFPDEKLDELLWQHQAPYIEPTSYLVKDDGSGCLDAVGKEVVFIKEGYFEQCKAIQQQQVDPQWSSFGMRRWQGSCLTGSMASMQREGIGYCKLGLIERCKVIKITYHRRVLPEKPKVELEEEAAEDPQSSQGARLESQEQSKRSRTASPVGRSAEVSEASNSRSEGEEDESDDEDEEEDEDLGQFFVRITLQRLPQKNDRLGPVCAVIDHYVDSGVGEYIIPRERYDSTISRRWKRGDRIQMYWADQASSGRGQWWEGNVVGYVKRKPEDPFRDSPWAAVTIKWSETGSSDNISPWELSPPEDDFRNSSESEMESDWDVAEPHNESEDEDWQLNSPLRNGGSSKRSRRVHREGSQMSDDSASSLDFEPARKKQRLGPKGLPETMQPRKSKGTVDWNKGHCAICKSKPDGSLVVECDGTCLRSFHARCLPDVLQPSEADAEDALWFCADCRDGKAVCAVCNGKGTAGEDVVKCKLGGCGNYFHPDCLRHLAASNPCVKIHKDSGEASSSSGRVHLNFTCPSHYCDRCHLSGDSLKIYRCWTCLKAVHGKCMERTEVRLNEKEMECKDCAAKKGHPAKAPVLVAAPAVTVWQPGKSGSQQRPKTLKWTASLTDVKVRKKVDLVGKSIFHFGSHRKGGGCDFLLPVANVKFHSELKVLIDGNVVIGYCHNKAKEIAEIEILVGDKARVLSKPEQLQHGDTIRIADAVFKFELRPWESSHAPLLLI